MPDSNPADTGHPAADPAARSVAASRGVGAWSQVRLAMSLVRLKPFDTSTAEGRSNERYRRIALTMLSTVAVRGLGTVLGLATVPLVLSYLGKERYGLWSTITAVVAWVALFDLGIASGLVNLVSRAHGRDDREEAGRHVSTALALLLGVAGALALAIAVAGPLVPWSDVLAVRGVVDASSVRWAVMAALATLVAGIPLSIVPQIYAGYQRSYATNAFALGGIVVGFAALLVGLGAGAGLPALVIAFGVGGLLASGAGLVHAFASMPWLRFRASAVSRDAMRALLSRSLPLFLFQLGAFAVNETQAVVLAHRCDLSTVAEYSIVMRLYLLALGLIQVSTASFVPSFREAHERGDRAWVRAGFRTFLRMRLSLAAVCASALFLLGNPALRLWLGRSDIAFSWNVWAALGGMTLVVTWVTAHGELLTIMDRVWSPVVLVAVNGVATITLTYWLAPSLGVLGTILAAGATSALLHSWVVPWLAMRHLARAA